MPRSDSVEVIQPDRRMKPLVRRFARNWHLPELEETQIRFSSSLRASLGKCRPSRGSVTLASYLQTAPAAHVRDVLGHELAHVAAHLLYGSAIAPHGPEWQELMEVAGLSPMVQHPSTSSRTSQSRTPARYAHRCAVCHSVWYAKRRMRTWRCAECQDAGLSGDLLIMRT